MDALIQRQQALLVQMDEPGVDEYAICAAIDEVEDAICELLADEVEAGIRTAQAAERLLDKLGIAWD